MSFRGVKGWWKIVKEIRDMMLNWNIISNIMLLWKIIFVEKCGCYCFLLFLRWIRFINIEIIIEGFNKL